MPKSHRFERSERSQKRSRPTKPPYDRMLIVCEGEKTEVNYFNAIRRDLRIPTVHIQIMNADYGTQPIQIVEFAEDKFKETRAFDRIYAVFDRDDHLTYNNALAKAAALDGKLKNDNKRAVRFKAVPSVPNFEFWILLHFKDVKAFMHRGDVLTELKKNTCYPKYEKNSLTVYTDTKQHLALATARAEKLREHFDPHSGSDPYTDADLLTMALVGLERRFV